MNLGPAGTGGGTSSVSLVTRVFPIKQNDHQATLQFTSSFSTTTSTVTRNSARTFGLNKEAHVAEEAHEHPNMYPLR